MTSLDNRTTKLYQKQFTQLRVLTTILMFSTISSYIIYQQQNYSVIDRIILNCS